MTQKIYHCEACGADFLAPRYRRHTELHPELDGDFAEVTYESYCPECGSSDVDYHWACELCGDHPATGGSEFCVSCQAIIDDVLDSAAMKLSELFDVKSWLSIESMLEDYRERRNERDE